MRQSTSFIIRSANPHKAFRNLVVQNGLLKNCDGIDKCLIGNLRISLHSWLVRVDTNKFMEFQEKQGMVSDVAGNASPPFDLNGRRILLALKPITKDLRKNYLNEHLSSLRSVESSLKGMELDFNAVTVEKMDRNSLKDIDLVIAVGGDGTFLKLSKHLDEKTPVFGVNSVPSQSFANFLKTDKKNFEYNLQQLLKGNYFSKALPRIISLLRSAGKDAVLPLALNDIYIKDTELAKSTRTLIKLGGLRESFFSDGLLISSSPSTGLNSWMNNSGGLMIGEESNLIQAIQFHPNRTNNNREQSYLQHFITAQQFSVTSLNRHKPFYAINGETEGPFNKGDKIVIESSGRPIKFIEFQ